MISAALHPIAAVRDSLPARFEVDAWFLALLLTLVSIGVLMVASASMDFAAVNYSDPWYLVKKQAMFLSLGLLGGAVVLLIPMQMWQQYAWILALVAMALLVLVLIPGIGREVNGSRRWILVGPISVQASEASKFLLVIFFANYFSRNHQILKEDWRAAFKPIGILACAILLLLCETDLGGAVVIAGTIFAMMFVAGVKLWQFLLLAAAGAGSLFAVAILSPIRMRRLVAFLDPWADQFRDGYQLTQSLIAFGQGEWFGVGLGKSIQKLFYLPDAHTDFIFAIIAEEFGLLGTVGLIGIFSALVYRILKLSKRAMLHNNSFISLLAFGIAIMIAGQVFINMGVASGLLPTKGLTLPFISYGGSSVIITCLLMALLLRAYWELLSQPIKKVKQRGKSASTL